MLENPKQPIRTISITGGKGGIGKTTLSINLAIAFAKMKKKVMLFDADFGLANIDIRLGLNPTKNIYDLISGKCELSEVCIKGPHGVTIIPASSGIQRMVELTSTESADLIRSFSSLVEEVDIMLIDTAPGISNQVLDITHASQDILIVICNDPASLMDSYTIIKLLHQKYARTGFGVIVNKVRHLQEGYDVFSKFQQAIAKFINVRMHYIGHVPQDDFITFSAHSRTAVVDQYPHSDAAIAFKDLCHGIDHWHEDHTLSGGIHFFFERLIQNNQFDKEDLCKA